MRVKQLIEELQKHNPDLPVVFTDCYLKDDGDFEVFENDVEQVNLRGGYKCTVVELEGAPPYKEKTP